MMLNIYTLPRQLDCSKPIDLDLIHRFKAAGRIIVGERSDELIGYMRQTARHPTVPLDPIIVLDGADYEDGLTLFQPLMTWLEGTAEFVSRMSPNALRKNAMPRLMLVAYGADLRFLRRMADLDYRRGAIPATFRHPTRIFLHDPATRWRPLDGKKRQKVRASLTPEAAAQYGAVLFPSRWLGKVDPELAHMQALKRDLTAGGWMDVTRWLQDEGEE